jgi:hypothetical protein
VVSLSAQRLPARRKERSYDCSAEAARQRRGAAGCCPEPTAVLRPDDWVPASPGLSRSRRRPGSRRKLPALPRSSHRSRDAEAALFLPPSLALALPSLALALPSLALALPSLALALPSLALALPSLALALPSLAPALPSPALALP